MNSPEHQPSPARRTTRGKGATQPRSGDPSAAFEAVSLLRELNALSRAHPASEEGRTERIAIGCVTAPQRALEAIQSQRPFLRLLYLFDLTLPDHLERERGVSSLTTLRKEDIPSRVVQEFWSRLESRAFIVRVSLSSSQVPELGVILPLIAPASERAVKVLQEVAIEEVQRVRTLRAPSRTSVRAASSRRSLQKLKLPRRPLVVSSPKSAAPGCALLPARIASLSNEVLDTVGPLPSPPTNEAERADRVASLIRELPKWLEAAGQKNVRTIPLLDVTGLLNFSPHYFDSGFGSDSQSGSVRLWSPAYAEFWEVLEQLGARPFFGMARKGSRHFLCAVVDRERRTSK